MIRGLILLWLGLVLSGCGVVTRLPAEMRGDEVRLFDLGLLEVARGDEPNSLQLLIDEFPSSPWRDRAERVMELSRNRKRVSGDLTRVSRSLRRTEQDLNHLRAEWEAQRPRADEWGGREDRKLFKQGLKEVAEEGEPQSLETLLERFPESPWVDPAGSILNLSRQLQKARISSEKALAELKQSRGRIENCAEENERLQYDLEQLKQLTIEMELRR